MNKLNILWASSNQIVNMLPLKQLSQLQELLINNNKVEDLSPLKDLKMLEKLVLSSNEIINIEPLRKMNQLLILNLGGNKITDLEPLQVGTSRAAHARTRTQLQPDNQRQTIRKNDRSEVTISTQQLHLKYEPNSSSENI
ncbi:Conserved_hypothetical protein [Hexamita inflata]|uniref:Uncharacterized protein n=1 Tax=Hexamita inflata TaxID=28002 RepID=A0AA86U1G4_9EUKA|nr:Conserved hypothetical protein [Hexamita inflata]